MKAGLYCRCSGEAQNTEGQERELRAYCQRQGWTVAGVYDDSGISGAKADNRPELAKLLRDAAEGRIGVVVVWKVDRLARSTVDLLNILTTLQKSGVHFCSSTQSIDTSSSLGKMILTLLGCVAEMERDTLIERIHVGIRTAKMNGVRFGRPRAGFDVNGALAMKRDGASWGEVATAVKVSKATVRRVLVPLLKTPRAA